MISFPYVVEFYCAARGEGAEAKIPKSAPRLKGERMLFSATFDEPLLRVYAPGSIILKTNSAADPIALAPYDVSSLKSDSGWVQLNPTTDEFVLQAKVGKDQPSEDSFWIERLVLNTQLKTKSDKVLAVTVGPKSKQFKTDRERILVI
jgi:hypothetical protein